MALDRMPILIPMNLNDRNIWKRPINDISSEFFRDAPPISVTNPMKLNTIFGGVNPLDQFHPNFEFYIICTYAVSGQYGFVACQLCYYTLIFSLMVGDKN